MTNQSTIEVSGQLKGRPVVSADTAERLGEVEDVVIDPARGSVLGLVLRDRDGNRVVLDAAEAAIGADAVMAVDGARPRPEGRDGSYRHGVLASAVTDAAVITEEGALLGRIKAVYVSTERPAVAYRVAESTLKGLFGGGFYIDGGVPSAVAADGIRFIVPGDTEEHYASSSPEEALDARKAAFSRREPNR